MLSSFFFIYLPLFFPLYLVRFRLFGIPFTLLEVLIDCAFLIACVEFFVKRKRLPSFPRLQFFLRSPILPIFIFFIASTISLFFSSHNTVALGIWKGWIVPSILFVFGFLFTVCDKKQVDTALLAYSFSAVMLGLFALFQVFTDSYITLDLRASGPFSSANYLALYIAPAFLYLALPGGMKGGFALQRFRIVGATILFFALFFSQSYAAFLSVFLAFVLWTFLSPVFQRSGVRICVFLSIVGATVFLSLAAFLFHGDSYKFQDFLAFSRQSSSSVRLEIWDVSMTFMREHPISGIGIGQFQPLYESRASSILGHAPYEATALHPHNLFFATWLYTGLLGLAALIWLLLLFFFRTLGRLSPSSLRLAAMMAVIVLHGLFDTSVWKNDLMPMSFLIAVSPFISQFPKKLSRQR